MSGDVRLGSRGSGSGGGGSATDLGYIAAPAQGTVTSSTGASAVLPLANGTNAGLMTPAQQSALASLAATYQPLDADLTALAAIAGQQGDIIYHNGTSWTRLGAGTSGLFLKTNGAGANPAWAAAAGGGSVATDAIWTAKGQLAAATGATAAVAVNVGADGKVITADAAQAAGVKYDWPIAVGRAKTSGGTIHYGVPGVSMAGVGTNFSIVANTVYYAPFRVSRTGVMDALQFYCATGSGTSSVRCGIYNADQDLQPTTLVSDCGTVSTAALGFKSITGLSVSLSPGLYVMAIVSDGTPQIAFGNGYSDLMPMNSADPTQSIIRFSNALAYGALPGTGQTWATATGGNTGFNYPFVVRLTTLS